MNAITRMAVLATAASATLLAAQSADALPVQSEIVPGPVGFVTGWATPLVVVAQGDTPLFRNIDLIHHHVTSDIVREVDLGDETVESPLFDSGEKQASESGSVEGVATLTPGDYGFHCKIHPNMVGTIKVVGLPAAASKKRSAARRAARVKARRTVVRRVS